MYMGKISTRVKTLICSLHIYALKMCNLTVLICMFEHINIRGKTIVNPIPTPGCAYHV